MASYDSVGQNYQDNFGNYRAAVAKSVALTATGNAVVALPILGGGVGPNGAYILRRITVSNPANIAGGTVPSFASCNVSITTSNDGNASNAVAAALRDPRFSPLTAMELDVTSIEVSLLSASEPMNIRDEQDALAQLRPGVDGVIFEYGHHRSTFLPQVWEEFADAQTFMGNLKYKGGLPPDFWDPAVKLSRYTVAKFRDDG